MKKIIVLVVFLSATAFAKVPESNELILKNTAVINQQTLEKLGVSLMALSYLLQADYQSYMPVRFYKHQMKYYEELQKAGYIHINYVKKVMPGNPEPQEMFQAIPTIKGGLIKAELDLP